MKKSLQIIITLLLAILTYGNLQAQIENTYTANDIIKMSYDELYNMPLDQLMQLAEIVGISADELLVMVLSRETKIATKKALTGRESPSIVSIITDSDIAASGARDFWDLLQMVPGFTPSFEVVGTYFVGLRGLMGQSRILLQIDGIAINELMYNTVELNNHISLEQIKQVEIIRGPGSAIYGGNAVLSVINIITKRGRDVRGAKLATTYSRMQKTYGRANAEFSAGTANKNTDFVLHGFAGRTNATDGKYYTSTTSAQNQSNVHDMATGGAKISTMYLNAAITHNKISARMIYDNYNHNTVDFYNNIYTPPYDVRFRSLLSTAHYEVIVNDKLTITPGVEHKFFIPWQSEDQRYTYYHNARRATGNINFAYQPSKNVDIQGGIEYSADKSTLKDESESPVYGYYNGAKSLSFHNLSVYAQSIVEAKYVNITAGARIDQHSAYDIAFSPRLGITKVMGSVHTKLLYGRSFRAPGIENMNHAFERTAKGDFLPIQPAIKPEIADSYELELGYQINKNMMATVNLFDIYISDPMVYFVHYTSDTEYIDGYYNAGKTGTQGVEFNYFAIGAFGNVNLNYSYYNAAGRNKVEVYSVTDTNGDVTNENALLGTPQHKLTISNSLNLKKNMTITPRLSYTTGCYAHNYDNPTNATKQESVFLVNFNFRSARMWNRFTIDLGVYDIFNRKAQLYPMFNASHAPYPGRSREIQAKIIIDITP